MLMTCSKSTLFSPSKGVRQYIPGSQIEKRLSQSTVVVALHSNIDSVNVRPHLFSSGHSHGEYIGETNKTDDTVILSFAFLEILQNLWQSFTGASLE